MNPTSTVSRPRRLVSAPAAVAILYPKVGNVLRVPLRRTTTRGREGCQQHPERQFIVWFNRMAAARPGFPMQLKSILLVTGQPLCASCQRALLTFLSRYHLADKLRVRSQGPAACGCGGRCGDDCRAAAPTAASSRPRLLLDTLLQDDFDDDFDNDFELEGEGWWQRFKEGAKAAAVAIPLIVGPQVMPKAAYDAAKAAGAAIVLRNKTRQTVDSNTPGNRPTTGSRELGYEFEAPAACPNPGSARPTLRSGARGLYAQYLQCRLNYHRANLPQPLVEDGVWGSKTQAAVLAFQRSRGLDPDAVVGPLTWGRLDAGGQPGPTIPPGPGPGPAPAGTTDVERVRFGSGRDIDAFFRAKTGLDFVEWFSRNVGGRGAWLNRQGRPVTMPATAAVKQRFMQFWDGIPLIFNTLQINFAQFAALQSVIINETGGQMLPLAERVGTSGHPGIAYAFDRIDGLKTSYNRHPNKTALALFNDPEFIQAHGQKPLGSQLARTTDARWGGDAYPTNAAPTSTDPAVAGFVQEADFYKFRGRGYIQITWRNAYQWLIPSVQNYLGSDPIILHYRAQWQGLSLDSVATRSGNEHWDELFLHSPEFPLSALRVFFGRKSDSINKVVVNDWASVRSVACDVMCTDRYKNLFEQRVRQIFNALGAAPTPVPGPVPPVLPGGVPLPIPATGRTEFEQRDAIVANALRMMAAPTIEAKVRDEQGFRKGWQKLKVIFELAAPAYVVPGWEENNLKRSLSVSNTAGIPHWCGIFAVWATKAAGRPVGTWQIGMGISRAQGFRSIPAAQVQRGDIGYINQPFQHHFIVREVYPDGTIDTIDGNSAATSTVSTKSRVPKSSINLFFTAF